MPISIHAPHTGRDRAYKYLCDWVTQFQSTRPIRGATITRATSRLPGVNFNPRAPYGARPGNIKAHNLCFLISIHAPHTGRDLVLCIFDITSYHFNPRAPYGARPSHPRCATSPTAYFNPRAPYGARPAYQRPGRHLRRISIHAPHTGRDAICGKTVQAAEHFNPRAPYGARLSCLARARAYRRFQSTRPIRGATSKCFVFIRKASVFQSTRPIRGATRKTSWTMCRRAGFQSTRPIRGATQSAHYQSPFLHISIHAPHTGRDSIAPESAG